MRREGERRLHRDGGFGLCLLASVLFHLLWLAVLPLPEQAGISPVVSRVFLVTAGQEVPAGIGGNKSARVSFVNKAVLRKALLPPVMLPACHQLTTTGLRSGSAAVAEVAVPRTVESVVATQLTSPAISPADDPASGESQAIPQGVGKNAVSGTVARGARQESESALGSSGAAAFLHRVIPRYPPAARRLGREGTVTLRLAIATDGELLDVEVLRGAGYGFTEAAVEAVGRSTFRPAVRDGRPIDSRALLRVVFALGNR